MPVMPGLQAIATVFRFSQAGICIIEMSTNKLALLGWQGLIVREDVSPTTYLVNMENYEIFNVSNIIS